MNNSRKSENVPRKKRIFNALLGLAAVALVVGGVVAAGISRPSGIPTIPTPTYTSYTATYTPSPYPTATWTPTYTPSPTPTMTATPTHTPTPTNTPRLTCVKFFYDGNMSGSKDENEPFLSPDVKGYKQSQDGCYYVPEGKTTLYITGKAPNGKNLLNATLDWPKGVNLLPQITVDTSEIIEIGLVDGFCSSPIRPENLFWEEYNKFTKNPDLWFNFYSKYFVGGEAPPNWLFYGYNVPNIGHRAFDIWAKPGTPTYAPVPGKIVEGDFDHIIGIEYTKGRKIDLNHINPVVSKGQYVSAGQLVGYIKEGEGNHVHMEARPNGVIILSCFAGLTADDLLKDPRQGPPPVLPYFGR
jgi:hypothetical protein